jgi:hypothetical protein
MSVQTSDKSQWAYPGGYKICLLLMDIAGHFSTLGDNFVNNHANFTFSEFTQMLCKWYHKV